MRGIRRFDIPLGGIIFYAIDYYESEMENLSSCDRILYRNSQYMAWK